MGCNLLLYQHVSLYENRYLVVRRCASPAHSICAQVFFGALYRIGRNRVVFRPESR